MFAVAGVFYFPVKPHMDDNTLINFGSELKSLGDNRFGGYLVHFGDPADTDLVGDYFTKDTDFGIQDGAKTPIYLNHRGPLKARDGQTVVVKQKIGEGTLKMDDKGVLIDAILYEHEQYEAVLTKMGWSSGTAAHLVDRERAGKAWHVKHWPLGLDASITPRPCQPHKTALSLKAYFDELEEDSEATKKSIDMKQVLSPEDLVTESLDSHSELVVSAVEEHAQTTHAIVKSVETWLGRARDKQEFRATKDGRTISAANRERIAAVMVKIKELSPVFDELHGALSELHALAEPKPKSVSEEEVLNLVASFEATKLRHTLAQRS